jgi:hypothetical protein
MNIKIQKTCVQYLFSLLCVVLMAVVATPKTVQAGYKYVRFCAEYGYDFKDANTSYGDDYLTSNGYMPAAGAKLRVYRISDRTFIHTEYADDSGTYEGCIDPILLDEDDTYAIYVYSIAEIGSNTLDSRTSSLGITFAHGYWAIDPSYVTTATVKTPASQPWSMVAALTHSLKRRTGGVSGQTINAVAMPRPSTGGSGRHGNALYTDSTAKYVIAHELGHLLSYIRDGFNAPNMDYSAPKGVCYTDSTQNHEMNSKEYQSAAALEGFAHYYAAVAFNNTTHSDCRFRYYKGSDWDLDFDRDDRTINCNGAPMTGVPYRNYLGFMCDGTKTNRGVEMDWMRFLWELDYTEGITTTKIFDVFDQSNPRTWAPRDGASSKRPASRLLSAASSEGIGSEWAYWDSFHGVDK